jgi:DNA mismatch repair protein MutS2
MDNAAMDYDEASERPTYRLTFGRPGRSRALEIAARMGVPEDVVERARELLGGDHLELDRWLRRLEELEHEIEDERHGLRVARAEVDGAMRSARVERERLEAERRELPERLAAEREELRRRAKRKLDVATRKLEDALQERRELGRRKLQKLRDEALALEIPSAGSVPATRRELAEGDRVRVALGGSGVLRELRGSQALVEVAGKKLWVAHDELELLEQRPKPKAATVRVDTADAAPRELNLIGLDSERAREDLERFLDQAMASGAPSVRVVHGHGAGVLRRMVAEVCGSHPAVRSFRHPPQHLGGTGATEVELHPAG